MCATSTQGCISFIQFVAENTRWARANDGGPPLLLYALNLSCTYEFHERQYEACKAEPSALWLSRSAPAGFKRWTTLHSSGLIPEMYPRVCCPRLRDTRVHTQTNARRQLDGHPCRQLNGHVPTAARAGGTPSSTDIDYFGIKIESGVCRFGHPKNSHLGTETKNKKNAWQLAKSLDYMQYAVRVTATPAELRFYR